MAECTLDDCLTVAALLSTPAFQHLDDVDNLWWQFIQRYPKYGSAFVVVTCIQYIQLRDGVAHQIPLPTAVQTVLQSPPSQLTQPPGQSAAILDNPQQSSASQVLRGIYYLVTLLPTAITATLREALYFPWTKHGFRSKTRSEDAELELRVWKQLSTTTVVPLRLDDVRAACCNPLDGVKHDLTLAAAWAHRLSVPLNVLLQACTQSNAQLRATATGQLLVVAARAVIEAPFVSVDQLREGLENCVSLAGEAPRPAYQATVRTLKKIAHTPGLLALRQAETTLHVLIDMDYQGCQASANENSSTAMQLLAMLKTCQQQPVQRMRLVLLSSFQSYFEPSHLPKDLSTVVSAAEASVVEHCYEEVASTLYSAEDMTEVESLRLLRDTLAHVYTRLEGHSSTEAKAPLDTVLPSLLDVRSFESQHAEQYMYQSLPETQTFQLVHQGCLAALQDILHADKANNRDTTCCKPLHLLLYGGDMAASALAQAWAYITATRQDLVARPLQITLLAAGPAVANPLPTVSDPNPSPKVNGPSRRGRRRPAPDHRLDFDAVELSRGHSASSLHVVKQNSSDSLGSNPRLRGVSLSAADGLRSPLASSADNDDEFAKLRRVPSVLSSPNDSSSNPQHTPLPDLSTLHQLVSSGSAADGRTSDPESLLLSQPVTSDHTLPTRLSTSSLATPSFVPTMLPVTNVDLYHEPTPSSAIVSYIMHQDLYQRRQNQRLLTYILSAHSLSTMSLLSADSSKPNPTVAKILKKLGTLTHTPTTLSPSYQLCQALSRLVFDSPGVRQLQVYNVEMILLTESDNHSDPSYNGRVASLTPKQQARTLNPSESLSGTEQTVHTIPLLHTLRLRPMSQHVGLPPLQLHLLRLDSSGLGRAYHASEAVTYTDVTMTRLRTDVLLSSDAAAQSQLEIVLQRGTSKEGRTQASTIHSCHLAATDVQHPFDVVIDGHVQPNVLQVRVTPCVRVLRDNNMPAGLKHIRELSLDLTSYT
eukprot:m.101622 g.101622  ORF g.101622 m.101622 type:complete len:988 (+) comp15177_c0_seq1:139-3102(+)